MNTIFLFTLSCLLLVMGHITRAYRWKMLFPVAIQKDRYSLILSLSVAYAINFILPFRIGELVRVILLSWYWKIKSSQTAATVVTERIIDVICLLIIYLAVFRNLTVFTGFPLLIAFFLFFIVLIDRSQVFRKYTGLFIKIFNHRIQTFLIDFLWSTSQLLFNKKMFTPLFLTTSLLMWSFYLLSYLLFSYSTGITFDNVINILFLNPLSSTFLSTSVFGDFKNSLFILYTLTPIAILLCYSLFNLKDSYSLITRSKEILFPSTSHTISTYFHHNFTTNSDFENFLSSLFATNEYSLRNFGLQAIGDARVHKVYNGGSGAITAVVENVNGMFIRKYVNKDAQTKLTEQFNWLRTYSSSNLPLVNVIHDTITSSGYYYDMTLKSPSVDFYEFIQNNPVEISSGILDDICIQLKSFHCLFPATSVSPEDLAKFHTQKIIYTIEVIKSFFSELFNNGFITIQNERIALDEWNSFLDYTWFIDQLYNFDTTVIHGDFTIENIIIGYSANISWFAIDPNPENIFNSPLIDWSKLMQSLNLGYEKLNKGIPFEYNDSTLKIDLSTSESYQAMHTRYCEFIVQNFGPEFLKAVYFYEIICYLRLLPYKIKHQSTNAIVFFGCVCLLIRNYHLSNQKQ